jgi:hypothetical protein
MNINNLVRNPLEEPQIPGRTAQRWALERCIVGYGIDDFKFPISFTKY